MNKKITFGVVGLLAVVALVAFFTLNVDKAKYNWKQTYELNDEHVYGTSIFHAVLEGLENRDVLDVNEKISKYFVNADSIELASNYFFVGPALYMDSTDVRMLLEFVERGSNVFISSESIPNIFMDEIFNPCSDNWYWNDYSYFYNSESKLKLNYTASETGITNNISHINRDSTLDMQSWSFISDSLVCTDEASLTPLGTYETGEVNFARQSYGDGSIYLHSCPIVFTNYHLLQDENLAYANAVFSFLSEGDIYWDDFNRTSRAVGERMNNRHSISSEGPLKYILTQESFAWAWYILLALAVLFVIFRGKRTQRIIPVLLKNENTSMQFISTIGTMYFTRNDHRALCLEQMELFLAMIRQKYSLNTRVLDEDFFLKLRNKTGVSEDLLKKILKYHSNILNSNFASENTMIEFHQLLNQFEKTISKKKYAL